MKKQIERVYTGQVAANYDAVRGNSARWARESEVIEPLLRTIPPGTKPTDVAAGDHHVRPLCRPRGRGRDRRQAVCGEPRTLGVLRSPLQVKVLYAVDGKVHCTHSTAPDRNALSSGQAVVQGRRYSLQDWRDSLAKSVSRRAAENYVAASRLAVAGIGPAVMGCAVVDDLAVDNTPVRGPAAGIVVDDLTTYPEKRSTTKRELSAAGVQLDRLGSAIRAQIRGYVSDLNSVVGVMPRNAAGEITVVERELAKRMAPPQES